MLLARVESACYASPNFQEYLKNKSSQEHFQGENRLHLLQLQIAGLDRIEKRSLSVSPGNTKCKKNQTIQKKNMGITTLIKGFRIHNLSTTPLRKIPPISSSHFFSSPNSRSFSSSTTPFLSSSPSPADVVPGTAEDVPDVAGGEEENLVYPVAPAAVKPATVPTLLQPRVVVYDGVCHLCHRGVRWVIEADKHRKIKFCCLQSKAAEPYLKLCGLDREDVLRRFLFVEGPGLYHQGSTAALRVLSYLPLPYSALSTLSVVPVPLRDAIYDFVAKHRYEWFGKADHCLVLKDGELLDRFIDRDEITGSDL